MQGTHKKKNAARQIVNNRLIGINKEEHVEKGEKHKECVERKIVK